MILERTSLPYQIDVITTIRVAREVLIVEEADMIARHSRVVNLGNISSHSNPSIELKYCKELALNKMCDLATQRPRHCLTNKQ